MAQVHPNISLYRYYVCIYDNSIAILYIHGDRLGWNADYLIAVYRGELGNVNVWYAIDSRVLSMGTLTWKLCSNG